MSAVAFLYGFIGGVTLVALALSALYIVLKRRRERKADIKGYLDLIPDLSEAQRARLQDIRRVFLPKVEAIRRDMRQRRGELAELLFSEPSDRPRITRVAQSILERQSELEHEVIEHILVEKELLTPSQKQRFYEIIVDQFSWGGLGVHDIKRK
jgi:hypothetical protein